MIRCDMYTIGATESNTTLQMNSKHHFFGIFLSCTLAQTQPDPNINPKT